jgi:hypothetical protein
MENISETLERLNELRRTTAHRATNPVVQQPSASIEETGGKNTVNSIEELPPEIEALIDNKMYRNKFRKYIREGYLHDLLQLAEIAQTKGRKSHWFAKVTAKANWEQTQDFLKTLRKVMQAAEEVVTRLALPAKHVGAVYKACWKLKDVAVRHAITAKETAKGDQFKYFCWLCFKAFEGAPSVATTA